MEENKKYNFILILLIIRILLGGFISFLTGIICLQLGFLGEIVGVFAIFAGVLCVPCVVLFFIKNYYFNICFFMAAAINTVTCALIMADLKVMLIFGISGTLIITMDILFLFYLGLSTKAGAIFGGGLFAKKEDLKKMENEQNLGEPENNESATPPSVEEEPQQYEDAQQTQTNQTEQMPPQDESTQTEQIPQNTVAQAPQNVNKADKPLDNKNKGPKLGMLIGFCVIIIYFVVMFALIFNFVWSETRAAISNNYGSNFNISEIVDRILGNYSDDYNYSYDNNVQNDLNAAISDYVMYEVGEDVVNELTYILNNTNSPIGVDFVSVYPVFDGIVIDVYTNVTDSAYNLDSTAIENEIIKNKSASDARKMIAEIIVDDVEEKTNATNTPISFTYKTSDDNTDIVTIDE